MKSPLVFIYCRNIGITQYNFCCTGYMTYPRGMAIAEAAWSNLEQRSWESFKERIYPNIMDVMKSGVSVRVPFEIIKR